MAKPGHQSKQAHLSKLAHQSKPAHLRASDLPALGRLAIAATLGVTDLVELMHKTILQTPSPLGKPVVGTTGGITGLVYRSVRGVTRLVGGSLDVVLKPLVPLLQPMLGEPHASPEREAVQAALNGVMGDYLAASANPLAIAMQVRHQGQALPLTKAALAAALPRANGKLLLLAHGLCMNDLQWQRQGHDHGAMLAQNLGYTPIYLHYNTGLHIASNGQTLAALLQTLTQQWPVPLHDFAVVGHSMGGLVARSAVHQGLAAGYSWPSQLRKLVFLGTPHHGAPLERGGHWIDLILGVSPYSAPFVRLGQLRSNGIMDLRYGSVHQDDWQGRERSRTARSARVAVPLPDGVTCYAVAATTGKEPGDLKDRLLGDGLVPLASALGQHTRPELSLSIAPGRQWIARDTNHMELLNRTSVYQRLHRWLAPTPGSAQYGR